MSSWRDKGFRLALFWMGEPRVFVGAFILSICDDHFFCDEINCGPVERGMSRLKVRAILGECEEFYKSGASGVVDDFSSAVARVYYDEKEVVKGVEVFRGGRVSLIGVDPFLFGIGDFCDFINLKGMVHERIGSVVISIPALRVRLYVPDLMDGGGRELIRCILI